MKRLIEVFVVEVASDERFKEPIEIMGTEEFEFHPQTHEIIEVIERLKGNRARVLKSYKLI